MPGSAHIAAVILAAGQSSRMWPANKLLVRAVTGEPMIASVAAAALASSARPVLVVVGHEADAIAAALAGQDVTFVRSPDYRSGLSASLRAGIAAVPLSSDGALVLLGDMPLITASTVDQVLRAFNPVDPRIIVPVFEGRQGHPILWPRDLFPEILLLQGDVGAKALLNRHRARITPIEAASPSVVTDFDTPDSLCPTLS